MDQKTMNRIANSIHKMSNVDLQQLVLGMCEDSAMMRERVIKCLDALDKSRDDSPRSNAQDKAKAARNEAWKKAKLAEHRHQIQRGLACIKDAELALQPALKEVMKMSGIAPSAQAPYPQVQSNFQTPTSIFTSQHPIQPSAPWPPLPPTTYGVPQGTMSITHGIGSQPADQFCKNCNASYRVAVNHPNACRYHSGKLRLDPTADIWRKKKVENPENTPEFHWLFPGGFKYDCCGQDLVERPGRVDGCVVSAHIPAPTRNMGNNLN
ncbi:hypothetical protein F4821DRAFT_261525 [Hypoxylon rubiginosum]|uniref:Uncharacterized protein n=1 Tax=Hypoxylon rubiginosum TaxID=110542 RepID=A0ACC0CWH2_9PEZI|nr:hypothetical protein F4821DRAFT_261525 [Hypoxylon rubiginosum]